MNSKYFVMTGLIVVGCCYAQGRFNYGSMESRLKAENTPIERVDNEHELNGEKDMPKPRFPNNMEEADELYKKDPRAFQAWIKERWPNIKQSLDLCQKLALWEVERQKHEQAAASIIQAQAADAKK